MMLSEAFGREAPLLEPIQLPYREGDHWLGLEFPEDTSLQSDRILFTAHYSGGFDKSKPQTGLLIDEWTEVLPAKEETFGMAFHYDRPNSEPPQSLLLVVPGSKTPQSADAENVEGHWSWNFLLSSVNETLDMAKKRAVEPQQLDETPYARFLPALVSAMTVRPITTSLNFNFNNRLFENLPKR